MKAFVIKTEDGEFVGSIENRNNGEKMGPLSEAQLFSTREEAEELFYAGDDESVVSVEVKEIT